MVIAALINELQMYKMLAFTDFKIDGSACELRVVHALLHPICVMGEPDRRHAFSAGDKRFVLDRQRTVIRRIDPVPIVIIRPLQHG